RRSRQSHDTKHTRAHALCDRFDGSSLAGAIAPFKHNHDPPAFRFDPFLEMTKFRLQPAQLLHVLLVLEFWFLVAVLFVRHRTSRLIFFLHRVALSNTREVRFSHHDHHTYFASAWKPISHRTLARISCQILRNSHL